MWTQVQKLLNSSGSDGGAGDRPAVIPLRKSPLLLDSIAAGYVISFRDSCPLPQLASARATVLAVRHYKFGPDVLKSYQLQIGPYRHFFMTVAEDEQGHYLSISRALSDTEQDSWFGRDALSFFMEPSTARTIRCKTDLAIEGDWAAPRYTKTVDWVEGSITQADAGRAARQFHYNLLVDESGEKALEIEHDDASGENRVFVTVYRPIEDIGGIDRAVPQPQPAPAPKPQPAPQAAAPKAPARPIPTIPLEALNVRNVNGEVPLFQEPVFAKPAPKEPVVPEPEFKQYPKQRPDFRRVIEEQAEEIHISRTSIPLEQGTEDSLPAFLLAREPHYLSLDEVIPPEPERVRVGLVAARRLIEQAMTRKARVRDVMRDMLGLESALSEEVIFELPLTDADYRTLAMRYKLRPDHRVEIRARLEEELQQKLLGL